MKIKKIKHMAVHAKLMCEDMEEKEAGKFLPSSPKNCPQDIAILISICSHF